MRLEGKVAIITGAASGIGRAMARLFTTEGAAVVLADLTEGRLSQVASELEASGARVKALTVDVSKGEDTDRLVDTATEAFGRVDVLCNNAGVLDNLTPAGETDDAMWAKVMGVNVDGPFRLARKVLPAMIAQGGGSIVNTASAAGLRGGRGGAAYTASKHALVGLTKSIAWFYGPQNVRCNAIAPGSIQTKMQTTVVPTATGFQRTQPYIPLIPMPGKAAEIAQVALFLASDDSSYVNGAILPADGGWISY